MRKIGHKQSCPSRIVKLLLAFFAALAHPAVGEGATFSFLGGDFTTHDAWRTTDVVKLFDADGDNVYGTDGYLLLNSNSGAPVSQPLYLNTTNVAPSQFGPSGSYVSIDDPAVTPGPGPIVNINTGTGYGGNSETDFVQFSISQAGSFRIGVLQDNHDFAAISPISLRLRQTSGGAADTGLHLTDTDRNVNGDWYFFDVVDATPGDVYRISGLGDTGHGSNGIGAVTFDTLFTGTGLTWNAGANGNWSDPTWTGGPPTFPNAADSVVATIDTPHVVTIDGARDTLKLNVSNGGAVDVAAATSLAVSDTTTVGAASSITVQGVGAFTSHKGTISLLNTNGGSATVGVGDSLDVNTWDVQSVAGTTLNKTGAGVLNVGQVSNATANTGVTVQAGTFQANGATPLGAAGGTITLDGGTFAVNHTSAVTMSNSIAITANGGGLAATNADVNYGGVTIPNGVTLSTSGAGQTSVNSTTLSGATATINSSNVHDVGTYNDGGANKTITIAGGANGVTSFNNITPGNINAASTTLRVTSGTLEGKGANPLGGASVTLAGGELKVSLGGGTAFSPSSTGMNAWFDASLGTTTDGNGVTTWLDQSGNGHNATRTNGTLQIAGNAINGLPAVRFNDNAIASMTGNMYSKTQFIVTKMDGGDWGAWMGSQVRSGYMLNQNGNFWDQNVPAGVSKNGTDLGGYPFYLGDDRTSQYMVLKIEGNDNNTSPRLYELGRSEGWYSLNNYLAEIISYDHVLSPAEENDIGGYLATKYGITTSYNGGGAVVNTSGNLNMSSTPIAVEASSTLNALTDGSASFGNLSFIGGVLTAKGSPGGISFNGTSVAAAATGGVDAKVAVALGPLTLGSGATFSVNGAVSTMGTSLSGSSATINVASGSTFNPVSYDDGGSPKTLTTGGAGTFVLNNSANTISAAATIFRIADGVLDTTPTATSANDPLGGATSIQMAGGKLKLQGETTTTLGALRAQLYYHPTEWNPAKFLTFSNDFGNSILNETPTQTGVDTGLGNSNGVGINYNGTFNTLFPGMPSTDHFQVAWTGNLTAPTTGNYQLYSYWSDDAYSVYVDLNQNGVFETNEKRWEGNTGYGGSGAFTLTGGQTYKVALGFAEWEGGENVGFHIDGPGGLNENVNPSSPNQTGMWSYSSIGALNLTSKSVAVDATSEIQAISDISASFGPLTLNNGVLTVSGSPSVSFASTTLNASATLVGLSSGGDMDAGIINGNGAAATFVKGGTGTLTLNTANTGLSNAMFDVQGGMLIAPTPGSLGGAAAAQLSGGTLWLSSNGGDVAYDIDVNIAQNGTLKVGKATGGADGPLTVTLGSPGKTLTVQNGKILTVSATDNYALNINNSVAIQDDARMDVSGAGVNINILGATTFTMGNNATLNLDAGTLTTDKALDVYNLNFNGGLFVQTGTGADKNLHVRGMLTINNAATNLDLTGGASLSTSASATINIVNGTISTDSALNVGNLTVEAGGNLNRTGSGAAGDVLVGDKLRLVNKTMDTTGSTLSVGNRIELDGSHLTSGNVLTVNSLWMNNGSTINSAGAMTVNGSLELYNGTNASFAGGLSVGDRIQMETNATLTYGNPLTFNSLWMNNYSTLTAGANTTINSQIELYSYSVADFSGYTLNTNWQNVYINNFAELKVAAGNNLNINYLQVWEGGKITAPGATITINDRAYLQRGTYAFNIAGNQSNSYVQITGGGVDDQNTDRDVHLTGTNTYTGETQIHDATVLVANDGVGLPSGSSLRFFNGVLGGSGTFTRVLGNDPGQVAFHGSGGFAGYGAPLTVSLGTVADGANAPLYWNSFEQGFNNQVLYLGSAHSTHNVTLTNNIEINSNAQIRTESRTTLATLSGNLTGTEMLEKQGPGTLMLAGDNSGFSGRLRIRRGAVDVGLNGAGLGSSNVDLQADTDDPSAKGAILQARGALSMTIGNDPGNIRWEDNGGGFAARGGTLSVTLNGGATINWNDDPSGLRGRNLMFGSGTADNIVTLTNNIDFQNDSKRVYAFDNPNSANDKAVLGGNLTNIRGFEKRGDGVLETHGNAGLLSTDGEQVRIYDGGTLKVVGNLRAGNEETNPDPRYFGSSVNNVENYDGKLVVTGNVQANWYFGGGAINSTNEIAGNLTIRSHYEQNEGTAHIGGNLQTGAEWVGVRNSTVLTVDGNLRSGAPSGSAADRDVYSWGGGRINVGGDLKANRLYFEQGRATGGQVPGLTVAGTVQLQDGIDLRTGSSTLNHVVAPNYVNLYYGADLTINGNLTTNSLNANEWDYWDYVGGRASSIHLNGATAVIGGGNGNINMNASNPSNGYGVLDGSATVSANYVGIHNKSKLGGTLTLNVKDKVEISDNSAIAPGYSPGTLTIGLNEGSGGNLQLNGGSHYLFEGGDLVDVHGSLTAFDNWNLDVLATGQRLVLGGSIALFKYGTLGDFDYTPNLDVSSLIAAGWLAPDFDLGTLSLSSVSGKIMLNGLQAKPSVWTGGSTGPGDNNWQTGTNWDLPAAAGAALQFAGSTRTTTNNDFESGTSFGGIDFAPGAAAFTLNGNPIALAGPITNNSSNQQTINLNIALSQTIALDTGSNKVTLGGNLSGAGGLIKSGNGELALGGVNTQAGAVEIQAGIVSVANDTALGATGPSGATLKFNGGTLKTTAGITSSRPVNVDAAGGTFDSNGFDSTFNGVVSGNGTLTKAGNGTLNVLGTSNTLSGSYNVTGGKLQGNSASLTAPVALSNNTNVTFDQGVDGAYSKQISGTGSLIKTGSGVLAVSGTSTYEGATIIAGGTLQLVGRVTTPGMNAGWFTNVFGANAGLDLDNAAYSVPTDRPFAGNAGVLAMTPVSTMLNYMGQVQGFGTLGDVGNNTGSGSDNFATAWSGTLTPDVSGSYHFRWDNDDQGALYIDFNGDGTFQPADRVGNIEWHGNGDASLTAGVDYNFIYMSHEDGGGESNNFWITKPGFGEEYVNPSSSNQTGMWNVVSLSGGDNRLPTNTPVSIAAGSTLDLNGVNQQIASLSNHLGSGGSVTNSGSSDVVLIISGGTGVFSGVISDGATNNISLVKSGSGTQTLSGNSTYSGTTTISGGTLLVNGDNSLATGMVTVESGGTLGGTGIIGGATTILSGGKLAPGASIGILTIDDTFDISGAVSSVNSQSLLFELGTNPSSDRVTVTGSNLFVVGLGDLEFDDFVFSGAPTAGTYTLFDTNVDIFGTLGTNLSGMIGSYLATLFLGDDNNDIMLNLVAEDAEPSAVPEPSTFVLAALGLAALSFAAWRRKYRRV
ncbi:MAG: autotransporter-associated beta strand repeat-containing protein [Planctomycetes bacterium]|nr:autotransporter-associated beta strand repeat-containing protein [Planctomycetota bacterium]